MKKLNLSFITFIGFIIISCSTDDGSNPNNSKILYKIKFSSFKQDGEIESYFTRVYENNVPKTDSFYNGNMELIKYFNWTYDNGKLSSLKGFSPENNITYETLVEYDNSQRIISRNTVNNNNISNIAYTYNSDNTVASVSEFNNTSSTKTFFINNTGLIYKEVDVNDLKEILYDDDNNVTTWIENSVSTFINYDNINLPPNNFPVNENFIFGPNVNNYTLYYNSIGYTSANQASINPKFLLSIEGNGEITRNEWILNNENFPINTKIFYQNRLWITREYIYK